MFNPDTKYQVVYSDPPWAYKTFSEKGHGRAAQAHYDCMSVEDIAAIPVKDWVADNAVLLMWVTDPFLKRGFEVMEAWGFEYTTVGFYWAKLNRKVDMDAPLGEMTRRELYQKDFFTGMGYYTRANPEQCLIGTRKKKPTRKGKDVRKFIATPLREHSRKPDEMYERIERLFDGPYLEMFSRNSRPGWDCWGNQVGLFDNGHVETRRIPSDLTDKEEAVQNLLDEGVASAI